MDAQKQLIVRNIVEDNGRSKLVYCSPNGIYIGEIVYSALNLEMLRKMSEDFKNYTSEVFAMALRTGAPQSALGHAVPVPAPMNGKPHG